MESNKIYHGDCQELIKLIPGNSIDCICTDPPYLYLKNQKLERKFDEHALFEEYKRVLKPNGFVVLFGRGTSFYRWNILLEELGYSFKEEIIWNKRRMSSPALNLGRVHETISLHSMSGSVNKVMLNYGEAYAFSLEKITATLQRLGTVLNKGPQFEKIINNLIKKAETGSYAHDFKDEGFKTTYSSIKSRRHVNTYAIEAMLEGVREQSIIEENRIHIGQIHPTQKPVRLLERLLALVKPKGVENPVVLDTFAGSCGIAKAAINTGWNYICMEIDEEYYNAGKDDVERYIAAGVQQSLF